MKAGSFPSSLPWILALLQGSAAAAGLNVDIGQREAVRNIYNALYYASENVDMGWTGGSIAACAPGTTGPAYREATLLRLNLFRALAGVPAALVLNETYNAKAQQAALMMSANKALSHQPPSHWACFTQVGSEAASGSNLALGSAGPAAINGYLWDLGDNNYPAGHRRWLFYPQVQEIGTGDVAGDGQHPATNALWYNDGRLDATRNPRPPVRDDFVAWPPPGYVPHALVSPRWSLSYPKADFTQATVSMSHNGVSVPVALEKIEPAFGAGAFIGENTLVWKPADASLADPTPVPGQDETFTVSVRDVKVNGQARRFDYTVTLFDPTAYGGDSALPAIGGCDAARRDANNLYAIQGQMPAADGFEWLSGRRGAYGTVQDAENGLGDMRADIESSYSAVTNETAAGGVRSYHLQDARAKGQNLVLDTLLIPGPGGSLSFKSRLAAATASETALVQVSLDGGRSWQDRYVQKGDNGAGEAGFVDRSLSLAEFQSRPIRVRFRFDIPDRRLFQYFPPGSGTGWYLDNIGFGDVAAVEAPAVAPAQTGGSFLFKPAVSGGAVLAARGTVQGHPLEWGPAKAVNVVAGTTNLPPVADAGPDLSSLVGAAVILDGRRSHDPDGCSGGGVVFAWTQTAGPAVTLAGADTAQPSFQPTIPGAYQFSLKASDGDLEGADTVTVSVTEPGPLRLLSPNGGETLKVKQKYEVRWESTGLTPKTKLKLQFSKNGVKWKTLKATRNTGRYVWKVTPAQVSETARLRLCGPNSLPAAQRCDGTDGTFRIVR
jgi:uncharacterized protein YkwD